MSPVPLFAGLVVDEKGEQVQTVFIGSEPMYVVNDQGFRRHISSETVDRQVLELMRQQVEGHEDIITEQAAKMLGQDDLFSRAFIQNQLKNMGKQFDLLLNMGIPEETRAYLGMIGMKIVINVHGDVVDFQQPGMSSAPDNDGE
jgi:hypothetical protein